jgi:hypothetical protein
MGGSGVAATQAPQPVANLAPAETVDKLNASTDTGSAIVSCRLNGRVVFMRKTECQQAGGR